MGDRKSDRRQRHLRDGTLRMDIMVRTLWHLLVVLVPKASMYVASKQQRTNTLPSGNPPIPEPCRLALRPSPPTLASSIRGVLPLPTWKKVAFLHNSCWSYLWAPYVRPCSRTPSASVWWWANYAGQYRPGLHEVQSAEGDDDCARIPRDDYTLEKQALLQKRREHEAQPGCVSLSGRRRRPNTSLRSGTAGSGVVG